MTTFQLDSLFDLNGKVALVTGASKGIGAEIARGLAACGARVVISSRKQDALDQLAEELNGQEQRVVAQAANVGRSADVAQLVEATLDQCGGLDILVNNAAANPVFGPVEQTDDVAFEKIMNVNLKGPFQLAKAALPHMAAAGGGSIINISSIGGISPETGLGIYSVSKAALISLTKVMAQEWGNRGVRVNAICPGLIRTKFSQALWQDEKILQRFLRQVPLGRMAEPQEVVGLTLYLASPAGGYSTGGVFTVDGGHTI